VSCSYDPNAFILEPQRTEDVRGDGSGDESEKRPKLSKSQQRKLKKIQEEKERRAQRAQLLNTLSEHKLEASELSFMRSVASRGQHESKKDVLRRALKMERAGLEVPEDMKLYLVKKPKNVDGKTDASSSGYSSEDEEDNLDLYGTIEPSKIPKAAQSGFNKDDDQVGLQRDELEDKSEDAGGHDPVMIRQAVERAKQEIQQNEGIVVGSDAMDMKPVCEPSLSNIARKVVKVERSEAIEATRSELPIVGMEQEIMESIFQNDFLILCGETGCGKTTQVPQFLYEGGYSFPGTHGIIGITQPRRVAAISTATRVAEEIGTSLGDVVGYHVRYDRKMGSKSALQFMTDGILLKELQGDFLLKKYNSIIIDEAHERSLNTDILLGMLSRVVKLRRSMFDEAESKNCSASIVPLKLIIMSATLRIDDFVDNKSLFKVPPPVLNVQARQYPVAVHFQKKTVLDDYVGAAFKKACQIHRKLPAGGILVFLTGQREVENLCHKLRIEFSSRSDSGGDMTSRHTASRREHGTEDESLDMLGGLDEADNDNLSDISDSNNDDDFNILEEMEEEDEFQVMNGGDEESREQLQLEGNENAPEKVWVLPLYAMLRPDQQRKVFKGAPEGHRLIIVATNIAETSLTIPGIRYVVDAGRSKQRILESNSGLAKYDIRWISKASAEQRAGRAGRMGPGHCYRLYSSAVFNDTFPMFSPPEINNVSLEGVVLLLKSIGVDKVSNFPFPSPPDRKALASAVRVLVSLSAIDPNSGQLTELGTAMSRLPVSPRHARLLLEIVGTLKSPKLDTGDSNEKSLLIAYAIRLVAAMSLESPFLLPSSVTDHSSYGVQRDGAGKDEEDENRKKQFQNLRHAHSKIRIADSDALSSLSALCAFEEAGATSRFCNDNFLIFKNLKEGLSLTKQLERTLGNATGMYLEAALIVNSLLKFPGRKLTHSMMETLKKAIVSGWGDCVAKRVRGLDYIKNKAASSKQSKAVRYGSNCLDEDVFLHPNSSLHSTLPEWLVYSEVIRTTNRPYMTGVTAIDPSWISSSVPALCSISEPLLEPPPSYSFKLDDVFSWHDARFGSNCWTLPKVTRLHPVRQERCAIFASTILDGKLIPILKKIRPAMVMSPSMARKPEMRAHKRVHNLITALEMENVANWRQLRQMWKTNPEFLHVEIKGWMKKTAHHEFDRLWPQLVGSALAA